MLIAACHVLLRLLEPRHPPYALIYFIWFSIKTFLLLHTLLRVNYIPSCQRTCLSITNMLLSAYLTIENSVEINRSNDLSI